MNSIISILTLILFSPNLFSSDIKSLKPWLGVAIENGQIGALVKSSMKDTPANKAGILEGDEIVTIDKAKVKTAGELIQTIASKK